MLLVDEEMYSLCKVDDYTPLSPDIAINSGRSSLSNHHCVRDLQFQVPGLVTDQTLPRDTPRCSLSELLR